MKLLRCLIAAGFVLAFSSAVLAQNSKEKEKSPADVAAEAFFKLRDDREAPIDGERAARVVAEGMRFLAENPRHGRVTGVINSLATYGTRMRDKKLAAVHDYWLNQLKFETVNRRTARDRTDDQQAVWGMLEVAVAAYQARSQPSRDAVRTMREKVDALAEMPKGSRFLLNAERDYLAVMVEMRAYSAAEAHAKKLLEHMDAKIVALAQDELKLLALRQTPVELKFTAIDGKAFDLASTRGKVVVVLFWSLKTEKFETDIEPVRDALSAQKNVEVVAVCLDPQASRAAVEKFVKSKRLRWTVLHDDAASAEAAAQFAVKSAPAAFVLDRSGTVGAANVRLNRIEAEVKRFAGTK